MNTAENRWALVTGSAKRIGRAIALELAAAGFEIIVHYNTSQREAVATARDIEALGRRAILAELDLANLSQVEKLIPALVDELGPLAALVNNASVFIPDRAITDKAIHATVNAEAPRILSETFYRQHLPSSSPLEGGAGWGVGSTKTTAGSCGDHPPSNSPLKGGRIRMRPALPVIVNILDADPTAPEFSFYNESKKNLRSMTFEMAKRFAPDVRVNGIAPGHVMPSPRQSPEHFQKLVEATPLGRAVMPQEIAAAVRFLIENAALTGAIISVDGGLHLNDRKTEADPKISRFGQETSRNG